MFCSNCGNRLADGAKFCSACGNRVQDVGEQEFRFSDGIAYSEPKLDTGAVTEAEENPAASRERVSFDWSAVVDEPHKKEIPDVKSPWATTGGIDEKELYAEMTPSTDRSRTMSFIDVLKAEKEEKEKRAEERAFVYTEVLEVESDMSSFNDAPTMNYAPLYDDVDAPVKTPFDDIPRKSEGRTFDNTRELSFETSRETIAQFDEYVKSFEAEAGIIHDEPRFETPVKAKPVSDEPKFELPDFLKRAVASSSEEPVFEAAADEAVSLDDLSGTKDIDFRKDIIDEPTFEVPKIDEALEEPVFEEPKYEEPAFEEPKYDDGDFDDGFDEYLELDTSRDEETVDERALFAEMEADKPARTGMTIAAPADKEDEVEALRKRLMELTGTDIKLDTEEKPAQELVLEPETTSDVDNVFSGLTAASEVNINREPKAADDNPEDLYLDIRGDADTDEPELLVLEDIKPEPAPAPVHASTENEPFFIGEVTHGTAPAPVVEEATPAPAPVVEEATPAPAPAVEEAAPAPAAEEPASAPVQAEEPKEVKSSDALSLEDLEKDLFGEAPTAEAEAEETKKIDKFYTLYRKNEEFQRLLDEEYDRLKGEGEAEKPADAQAAAAAPAAEIPAEQSKAYRQVEDETIYKEFEIPPELIKDPPKEAEEGAAGVKVVKAPPAEVPAEAAAPAAADDKKAGKVDKKAAKEAAKAEKAKQKQAAKAAKAKAKADAATGVEYEEVDTGSGFLTVLAVVIAIILVILLAVILILQIAPDSSIAIAIDSLIERLTGGIAAIDPGNGPFLL